MQQIVLDWLCHVAILTCPLNSLLAACANYPVQKKSVHKSALIDCVPSTLWNCAATSQVPHLSLHEYKFDWITLCIHARFLYDQEQFDKLVMQRSELMQDTYPPLNSGEQALVEQLVHAIKHAA